MLDRREPEGFRRFFVKGKNELKILIYLPVLIESMTNVDYNKKLQKYGEGEKIA